MKATKNQFKSYPSKKGQTFRRIWGDFHFDLKGLVG